MARNRMETVMKYGALVGLLIVLVGCMPAQQTAPTQDPLPQSFVTQAVAFLDGLQPRSIAENREYCGFFGRDAAGRFTASAPIRGGSDFCDLDISAQEFEVVASYHTHAAFDTQTENEVPSDVDLLSDIADGVYGFIATPGGRIWLTNPASQSARQVCGIGCVSSDPEFIEGDAGFIAQSYTLSDLKRRF
ncbi:MAG: DUF4329 domain-containing protein [Pseudomonadota bacterium]